MLALEEFVQSIISHSQAKNTAIKKALLAVDRAKFVSPELSSQTYDDYPLPIGFGQTISQPSTVVFMLEQLNIKPGQKILEVGSGCGWVSALLAFMVGDKGRVIGLEVIPELVELARDNVQKVIASSSYAESEAISFKNLQFVAGDGSRGYAQMSPYDRIIVSAGATEIPQKLLGQLKDGGRAVIPVGDPGQDMLVIERQGGEFKQTKYPGFVFVPLVSK